METQNTPVTDLNTSTQFETGTTVIYGAHGKCTVVGCETKTIGSDQVSFYKLELQKSPLSRSQKKDPAIWVPIKTAKERGLRTPVSADDIQHVKAILTSREYFFSIHENWNDILPKLENVIRIEGCIGLAKVVSYLFVLNRKTPVANTEATKFQESVNKLFYRELADAMNQHPKEVEQQMLKPMRQKLLPSN